MRRRRSRPPPERHLYPNRQHLSPRQSGPIPLHLIEIQVGNYLGEHHIMRLTEQDGWKW
jgi:mannose-6-phosphate isomerase-like protein (cupin superfamily)